VDEFRSNLARRSLKASFPGASGWKRLPSAIKVYWRGRVEIQQSARDGTYADPPIAVPAAALRHALRAADG
jgi:hypothetical protein